MRPILHEYQQQNEYTTPLCGRPYYRNSGIIYAIAPSGEQYAVGRVDLERYDEQNFQYVFSPEWSVIDALPTTVFQGIPGLDMSLRLERYYRVNMTPYFIAERTPSEGREDLWELLEAVGLDYYDRFEWLLRSDMRCGTDNLIVKRATEPRRITVASGEGVPTDLQPGDCVTIHGLGSVAATSQQLRQRLLQILRSGAQIWDSAEERMLSGEERGTLLNLLMLQATLESHQHKLQHDEGVARARQEKKYTGRRKIPVDQNLLRHLATELEQRRITETEAMQRSGIPSRSTFYRRLKEFRQTTQAGEDGQYSASACTDPPDQPQKTP